MKKFTPKVGDQVVVTDSPDATIYCVDALAGDLAALVYLSRGVAYRGGVIDVSVLRVPNATQHLNWDKRTIENSHIERAIARGIRAAESDCAAIRRRQHFTTL